MNRNGAIAWGVASLAPIGRYLYDGCAGFRGGFTCGPNALLLTIIMSTILAVIPFYSFLKFIKKNNSRGGIKKQD